MKKLQKPTDYPCIRMWGNLLSSKPYYIDAQVNKARETKAPYNATYQRQDGSWSTADDIQDIGKRPDMRAFLDYRSAK